MLDRVIYHILDSIVATPCGEELGCDSQSATDLLWHLVMAAKSFSHKAQKVLYLI